LIKVVWLHGAIGQWLQWLRRHWKPLAPFGAIGAIGLFLFFLGFEFAIVTSFSIVSEAMPAARGRALATNNAVSTVARGCGIVASGVLYEQFGINGPAAISITTAVIGLMLLSIGLRRSQHNMNVPLVALAGQKP